MANGAPGIGRKRSAAVYCDLIPICLMTFAQLSRSARMCAASWVGRAANPVLAVCFERSIFCHTKSDKEPPKLFVLLSEKPS